MYYYQNCFLEFCFDATDKTIVFSSFLSSFFYQQDTKIASLERNIRDLEDEIQMLKANGVLNTEDREEEIKQIEVYKSHSKFMKTKVWSKVINFYTLSVTGKLWFTYVFSPNTHIICLV